MVHNSKAGLAHQHVVDLHRSARIVADDRRVCAPQHTLCEAQAAAETAASALLTLCELRLGVPKALATPSAASSEPTARIIFSQGFRTASQTDRQLDRQTARQADGWNRVSARVGTEQAASRDRAGCTLSPSLPVTGRAAGQRRRSRRQPGGAAETTTY